ncbi:MAG: hypothetical protein NZ601_05755, partial [candidate division WOR-3 bacterium]|nr:hypothetical protein [candidate division WOR-3 bacterium]MDW7987927.1 hypothetical protein [candidate division WOR-3 bacterium]
MKNFQVCDWGLLDYKIAHCKQKELHRFRVDDLIPDTLIFVEHPTTFTIGKHVKINNLLVDKKVLAENNIELYHIERGGDITLHNP